MKFDAPVVVKRIPKTHSSYSRIATLSQSTTKIIKKVVNMNKIGRESDKHRKYNNMKRNITEQFFELQKTDKKIIDIKEILTHVCGMMFDEKSDEDIFKYLKINLQSVFETFDTTRKKIEIDYQEMLLKSKQDMKEYITSEIKSKQNNDEQYLISFKKRSGETSFFTNEAPMRLILDYPNDTTIPEFVLRGLLLQSLNILSTTSGKQITVYETTEEKTLKDEFDHIRNRRPTNLIHAWQLQDKKTCN